MHYNLCLIGFGNVARSLVRLLERKSDLLKSKYSVTYSITGIATGRHGYAVNPNGLDARKALELVETGQSINSISNLQSPITNSPYAVNRQDAMSPSFFTPFTLLLAFLAPWR
ncbi:MAG: hypothetical protein HND47_02595 [Chloroflexi bacterium]|nr:hypothetical protein [Chloroflexota bacterium]